MQRTRAAVVTGWGAVARQLEEAGAYQLADYVNRFVEGMPPPVPDQLQLIHQLRAGNHRQRIDTMEWTR